MIQERKNNVTMLRALSCLLIVNVHMNRLEIPFVEIFNKGGFVFNTVFLLLSGYLLMVGTKNSVVNMKWIKKRFGRIYPSYLIAIVIIICTYSLLNIGKELSTRNILMHLSGLQYLMGNLEFGGHLWFVSIILICYLLFKPSKYFIETNPARYFLSLIILFFVFSSFSYSGGDPSFALRNINTALYSRISGEVHMRFYYHFLIFSIGIFYYHKKNSADTFAVKPFYAFLMFIVSFAAYAYLLSSKGNIYSMNLFCVIMAFITAVCFCIFISSITFVLEKQLTVFTFLAGISYEIYLIHSVIIDVSAKYINPHFSYLFVYSITILLAFAINHMSGRLTKAWATR